MGQHPLPGDGLGHKHSHAAFFRPAYAGAFRCQAGDFQLHFIVFLHWKICFFILHKVSP